MYATSSGIASREVSESGCTTSRRSCEKLGLTPRFPTSQDALISFSRQDDYLILFQRVAAACRTVQVRVQNQTELLRPGGNHRLRNHLHYVFCTASHPYTAPKVCVDFCERSVKVAPVDGRKGWHNHTEPVRSRLSDKPGGATCQAARPEKTDCSARFSRGLGPRKR